MMHKDIQTFEHAARIAMAGNDDPLPAERPMLKPLPIGLALLVIAGAAWFILA